MGGSRFFFTVAADKGQGGGTHSSSSPMDYGLLQTLFVSIFPFMESEVCSGRQSLSR